MKGMEHLEQDYLECVQRLGEKNIKLAELKRELGSIQNRIKDLKLIKDSTDELTRARDKLRYVQNEHDSALIDVNVAEGCATIALLKFKAELEME